MLAHHHSRHASTSMPVTGVGNPLRSSARIGRSAIARLPSFPPLFNAARTHAQRRTRHASKAILVIGVGNPLRSDAGVGRYVIERLSSIPPLSDVADIAYTSLDIRVFDLRSYAHVTIISAAHRIPQPVMYAGGIEGFVQHASPLIQAFHHWRDYDDMRISGWLIPVRCTSIGMELSQECRSFADSIIVRVQERIEALGTVSDATIS